MKNFGILLVTLAASLFLLISAVGAQTPPPEYPWTGKTAEGKVIAKVELDQILAEHKKWLTTTGKEGQRADLAEADLTGVDLNGANLTRADLHKAILRGANLSGADLSQANLGDADLKEANLSGAYLFKADLSGADLKDANLKDAILNKAKLKDADLSGANLGLAGLGWADLRKSNLSEANLSKTKLRADLHGANLAGANLIEADLKRANLSGANLSGANLKNADLTKAILVGANLSGADLTGANLTNADLRDVFMVDAILRQAELRNVSLHRANLTRVDLRGVLFEPLPSSLPPVNSIVTARGLGELWYENYPQSLIRLRRAFQETGYRQQEREVDCAVKRSETLQEWRQGGLGKIKAALNFVFFDLTCNYGASLWRPMWLVAGGVLLFLPFYCLALVSRRADTGIWLVWLPDRVLKGEGREEPEKLTTTPRIGPRGAGWAKFRWQLRRGWRILAIGFSVSLGAAFSLGRRGLKAGNWISRLGKKEYTLRLTGWVRTLAGVQSLISAYLLALWVVLAVARLVE